MENIKLTKLGMSYLGEELGILDENSPITKTNKSFYNRVELLTYVNDIRELIITYDKEKKKFNSEIEYIEYIERSENELYRGIEDSIGKVDITEVSNMSMTNKMLYQNTNTGIEQVKFLNTFALEIGAPEKYELLNTLKYWVEDIRKIHTNRELIAMYTDCEYLQVRDKLSIEGFKLHYRNLLLLTSYKIKSDIVDSVSDILNKKQLAAFNEQGKVVYNVPRNISANSIAKMSDNLKSLDCFRNRGYDLDISQFRLRKAFRNSDMIIKLYFDGRMKFYGYTPLELHHTLRSLYGQEMCEDDLIFELGDISCKASSAPKTSLMILE